MTRSLRSRIVGLERSSAAAAAAMACQTSPESERLEELWLQVEACHAVPENRDRVETYPEWLSEQVASLRQELLEIANGYRRSIAA